MAAVGRCGMMTPSAYVFKEWTLLEHTGDVLLHYADYKAEYACTAAQRDNQQVSHPFLPVYGIKANDHVGE